MVIQHNLTALNSHRNMGLNNSGVAKNLEKLSSGYKINRAGDDAAGLAISEKMRGQIRGLAMAEQNVSNGVSLIQTAEGGLNETHAILQRMRELAVQSANGTYDEEVDRLNLDKEFQALKSEIDRIASSTHYNGIKLLDGSLGGAKGAQAIVGSANADAINGTTTVPAVAGMDENLVVEITTAGGATGTAEAGTARFVLNGEEGNATMQIGNQTITATFVAVTADGSATATATFKLDSGAEVEVTFTSVKDGVNLNGVELDTSATMDSSAADTATNASAAALKDAILSNSTSQLVFQIGANGKADQRVGLHVDDMSSVSIGSGEFGKMVSDINISTQDNAKDVAIEVLNDAINQVSGTRADLGALQNRLEHTSNNLGVTKENLTAAESSIRDVDMAKEMMEFTKNNILVQASQAMLAQANQLPQGVLSLLR